MLLLTRTRTGWREELHVFYIKKILRVLGFLIVGVVVLGGLAIALGFVRAPWDYQDGMDIQAAPRAALKVELMKGTHTLVVPKDVQLALGIRRGSRSFIHAVEKPKWTQPLVMPGSTDLDPARLLRVRARFAPAELVTVGQVPEISKEGAILKYKRELRAGDEIKKGDLLGVFYSDVVGNKKNDLVDAVLQIVLDDKILKRAEANAGSLPEIFILNAQRNFQGDLNAINRAMNTLKTWVVPEEDIESLVGKRILQAIKGLETWDIPPLDVQSLKDKAKDTSQWGRIELRSPIDGVLIERNVALHELVQDATVNIFQIAKVDRLNVLANVPEDDLPKLQKLRDEMTRRRQPMSWVVRTVGSKPIEGVIDDIGYLIDRAQHTAVVKGHIDNPKGALRAGQFISATVDLLPPDDVVEVPMDALVEDGQQAIVFVETNAKKNQFTMRRVNVVYRFENSAFVSCANLPKEKQRNPEEEQGLLPKEPLHVGDRVILRGAVELKAALLDKKTDSLRDAKEKKAG
jgi:cobalt-zinc-cadmium efflux system membrane fusion protein